MRVHDPPPPPDSFDALTDKETTPIEVTTRTDAKTVRIIFGDIFDVRIPFFSNVKKVINPPAPRSEKIIPITNAAVLAFCALLAASLAFSSLVLPIVTLVKSKTINGRTPKPSELAA